MILSLTWWIGKKRWWRYIHNSITVLQKTMNGIWHIQFLVHFWFILRGRQWWKPLITRQVFTISSQWCVLHSQLGAVFGEVEHNVDSKKIKLFELFGILILWQHWKKCAAKFSLCFPTRDHLRITFVFKIIKLGRFQNHSLHAFSKTLQMAAYTKMWVGLLQICIICERPLK